MLLGDYYNGFLFAEFLGSFFGIFDTFIVLEFGTGEIKNDIGRLFEGLSDIVFDGAGALASGGFYFPGFAPEHDVGGFAILFWYNKFDIFPSPREDFSYT